jgi:hypothetical protein
MLRLIRFGDAGAFPRSAMKKTAAAWGAWLTGIAVLFVVEWFRVAAAGRPLRGIPNNIMLAAWLLLTLTFAVLAYQGTASIRSPSLRFACAALQIVAIFAIHYVAGQVAIHLFIQAGGFGTAHSL